MKRLWGGWKRIAIGLAALVLLAALVSVSGVIPIRASFDHPEPFASILDFSKRRSVATWSLGTEPPPHLDDPALMMRGAGHYETACRSCHGIPGGRRPWVGEAMSPPPPDGAHMAEEFSAEELYTLVRYGVAFTAMPAWPAEEREDEPWALVAFLRAYPTLDAESYANVVFGDRPMPDEMPDVVARLCARCHGIDGSGRIAGAFPRLGGQREAYLRASLHAYANGMRHSGFMEPVAAGLDDEAIAQAAQWYSSRPSAPPRDLPHGSTDTVGRGAAIARDGIAADRIPACAPCHGPSSEAINEAFPELAAQEASYLRQQLRLFRDGQRGGSPHASLMQMVTAHAMDDATIDAVSDYYASMPR